MTTSCLNRYEYKFYLLIIFILTNVSAQGYSNNIKFGNAHVVVNVVCDENIEIQPDLEAVLLTSSFFENPFNYDYYNLIRKENEFYGDVPVQTEVTDVGFILRDRTETYLMGIITLIQDTTLTIKCKINDDNIKYSIRPEIRFNKYPINLSDSNHSLKAAKILMSFSNYHLGLMGDDEPNFSKDDTLINIRQKLHNLKKLIRMYAYEDNELPSEIHHWIDNICEYDFMSSWILSPERLNIGIEKIESIPYEAFDELENIDKDEKYFDKCYFLGPYSFFKNILLRYPQKISAIDSNNINEWKMELTQILKNNMQSPSETFLNLMAMASYKIQIDANNPLTELQLHNIYQGLPLDYALILERNNNQLIDQQKDSTYRNLTENKFVLKEYIKNESIGKYIYVDLWNTWCMPCMQQFKYRRNLDLKKEFADVEIINLCDDSSDIKGLKKLSREINDIVLISSHDMLNLMNELNVDSFPSHLLFDRDGNLISSHSGFLSNDELVQFIKNNRI